MSSPIPFFDSIVGVELVSVYEKRSVPWDDIISVQVIIGLITEESKVNSNGYLFIYLFILFFKF